MHAHMNTRLPFLTIIILALPLGLLAPSGALAQAKDEPKPAPAASPGRQAVSLKLERIRLEHVRYEGLPLGEVVINLGDEAIKRDPEKKGINFMINPNQPADYAPVMGPVLGPDGEPVPPPRWGGRASCEP
jgi:hypothetical protein